jgi:hypothetical protein
VKVSSIAEQLLFATVRIETDTGVGTGFFFGIERNGQQYGFLVTNKHVIKNTSTGRILFTISENKQPILGKTYWLNITHFGDWWYGHSDPDVDIAIAPIGGAIKTITDKGISVYHRFIHENLIPDAKQVEDFDAIEEIVFIGYPNDIWDNLNNLPVTRRGITATPLAVDFRGKKQFLIDGSVFPGSSGSPVFVLKIGGYSTKAGDFVVGNNKLVFVGIVSSVFYRRAEGKIEMTEAPTAMVPIPVSQEMIDLGLVIKSSVLIETIEQFLGSKGKEEAKPVTTVMS